MARQSGAGYGKTVQGKAGQSMAEQSRGRQGRAKGRGKARKGKARQAKARQSSERQGRARQRNAKTAARKIKHMMYHNPDLARKLFDKLAVMAGEYAVHQIDSGAQVIQVFESWAHHLSPADFEKFAKVSAGNMRNSTAASQQF